MTQAIIQRRGPILSVGNAKANATFALSLNDLGSGAVDTSVSRGVGPATFTRATAATCWSSAGLLLTVATGVARSNYTELTGASYLGYWSEDARTNNCLWNRDFTNAAWVKTTMTVALDQVGIDGAASSASSLLATGANSTVKQTITIAAVNRPFSVYIKRITGTGNVDLAQDGSTYTTQTLGASWTRCTLVASQLNPILSIRLVTSGDKIAVDYAALEDAGGAAATFPTNPIATTTVAVTRNADALSYPLAGNANAVAGTAYAEMSTLFSVVAPASSVGMNVAGAGVLYIGAGSAVTTIQMDDGTNVATKSGLTSLATGVRKRAAYWGGAIIGVTGDGLSPTTATFDGSMGVGASITIGSSVGTNQLFGGIKNVRIWQRQLPDGVLQQMTT